MGLGAVGPKADRFGETPVLLNSETWYLDYLWQAGYVGLFALMALAAIILLKLWRGRRDPAARLAMAVMVGLGAGALFIPVLDEPAVAIPMWTLVAFGLLSSERATDPAGADLPPAHT
jgi:O-antigen ligase